MIHPFFLSDEFHHAIGFSKAWERAAVPAAFYRASPLDWQSGHFLCFHAILIIAAKIKTIRILDSKEVQVAISRAFCRGA